MYPRWGPSFPDGPQRVEGHTHSNVVTVTAWWLPFGAIRSRGSSSITWNSISATGAPPFLPRGERAAAAHVLPGAHVRRSSHPVPSGRAVCPFVPENPFRQLLVGRPNQSRQRVVCRTSRTDRRPVEMGTPVPSTPRRRGREPDGVDRPARHGWRQGYEIDLSTKGAEARRRGSSARGDGPRIARAHRRGGRSAL